MASSPMAVGSSATLVHTMNGSGNETLWIKISPGGTVYLGPNASVSTSNGTPFGPGSDIRFSGQNVATSVYAICATGALGALQFSATTS